MQGVLGYGAAQESNLPSDGLRRLTGFEALLRKVHLRTEAGFRPRFSPSKCGEVRSDRYQFRYQVIRLPWPIAQASRESKRATLTAPISGEAQSGHPQSEGGRKLNRFAP